MSAPFGASRLRSSGAASERPEGFCGDCRAGATRGEVGACRLKPFTSAASHARNGLFSAELPEQPCLERGPTATGP
jgi:hypothetical protein